MRPRRGFDHAHELLLVADSTFGIEANQLRLPIHSPECHLLHTLRGLEQAIPFRHAARLDAIPLAPRRLAARVTELHTRIEVERPICHPDQPSQTLFANRAIELPS
jgi:hypothetical protein